MKLMELAGSGHRIMMLVVPAMIVGSILNVMNPSFFSVGGPPTSLMVISILISIIGIAIWLWSVILILTKVPKKELITIGPYSIVKHPLYTSVALLVLPWIGIVFNTWLGVYIGAILLLASRIFSPEEEAELARTFGEDWEEYCQNVKFPWL